MHVQHLENTEGKCRVCRHLTSPFSQELLSQIVISVISDLISPKSIRTDYNPRFN